MVMQRRKMSPASAAIKGAEPENDGGLGRQAFTPERATADLGRQITRATRTHKVTGAKLSVDRRRPQAEHQAILGASRNAQDPATGYRLALGVSAAMANNILDGLGLLAEEGRGGARTEGSLDRQQIAVKREEERLPGLSQALVRIREAARGLNRKADLQGLAGFQASVAAELAPHGIVTPATAVLEQGVIEACVGNARDFSASPDDERLLKCRFFSVQKDALRVESGGESLVPPQIFGFEWTENGDRRVAGISVPSGSMDGRADDGIASASKEPDLVLDAHVLRVVDPQGGPQSYEQVILESRHMGEFFAERGVDLKGAGGKISGDSLRALEAAGFKAVTTAIRTGDFLPRGVQERLIPGKVLFEGVQGKESEVERIVEIVDMARERTRATLDVVLQTPAMIQRLDAAAEKASGGDPSRKAEHLNLISKQQYELHEARMDMALGASQVHALKCLTEYMTVRQGYVRTATADPFQVELGRNLTRLLSAAGLAKNEGHGKTVIKGLYMRLDQIMNKAHERWGNADHIRVCTNPLDRHPLVMAEAMKEMRRLLAYVAREKRVPGMTADAAAYEKVMPKPVLVPGLADEKIDEVLGEAAQAELVGEFNRSVKQVHAKGRALNAALGDVVADGIADVMLAEGAVPEAQITLLRNRLRVKVGSLADRYSDTVRHVTTGGQVVMDPAVEKPAHVAAVDATIAQFTAVDGDGRWVNPALHRATEEPTGLQRELEVASREHSDALATRANVGTAERVMRATRMVRARESFKFADSIMGALEDFHLRPQDALRLPKALGAVTRDSREDELKATMPYAAVTPVVEEGRTYVVPVRDSSQGDAYMFWSFDRGVSGDYTLVSSDEIATNQLAKLIEESNQCDFRLEILRHGMDRGASLKDVLPRFGVMPIAENRFLVNVQTNDNGRIGDLLGLDMRGTFWPEARLDRQKDGFSRAVSERGGFVMGNEGLVPAKPAERLSGKHVYLRVREKDQRQAQIVYFPMPETQAELPQAQARFARFLDSRVEGKNLSPTTSAVYQRFRVLAMTHFNSLAQAALDGTQNGYAALAPKFQAGVFEPDLFGMTFFPVQERQAGDRARAAEDPGALRAMESLTHLRSRLGCQVDVQAVRI